MKSRECYVVESSAKTDWFQRIRFLPRALVTSSKDVSAKSQRKYFLVSFRRGFLLLFRGQNVDWSEEATGKSKIFRNRRKPDCLEVRSFIFISGSGYGSDFVPKTVKSIVTKMKFTAGFLYEYN
ncbi:hypothetical protein AVEN_96519-1 [Araneus ventricosus]|uniref:Uncharacterized protein n=1 Tax=Araneus ventricosus TaxID=182803 RepID=A0A4Y2CVP3_ARAVE|nr:hypothetical protein AVEN_96519-1 [Araneus ventricosus]